MTMIYPAPKSVKCSRFGLGVLPARAARFVPSAADLRWAAMTSPTRDRDYDVLGPSDDLIEEAAAEAAMRSAYEAGIRF